MSENERPKADSPVRRQPTAAEQDAALHPNGKCRCCGEGTCGWCKSSMAKTDIMWVKGGRLWHAAEQGSMNAICGRDLPLPRDLKPTEDAPDEDVRCAKCDRIVRPNGDNDGS